MVTCLHYSKDLMSWISLTTENKVYWVDTYKKVRISSFPFFSVFEEVWSWTLAEFCQFPKPDKDPSGFGRFGIKIIENWDNGRELQKITSCLLRQWSFVTSYPTHENSNAELGNWLSISQQLPHSIVNWLHYGPFSLYSKDSVEMGKVGRERRWLTAKGWI